MGRTARLFFEVAYSRCRSMRTSMGALDYLVGWGRASDAAGRSVDVEEYAKFVGVSRSQAFRRQASFRACFPKDDIATTWAIVKSALDNDRNNATKSTMQQAVIVGTFRWNPETWPPKKGSKK